MKINQKSPTSKKISYRGLIAYSLPSILVGLIEPLASLVDTALVGHLQTKWLAALAIAVTILSSFTWIFNFLVHGNTALLANYRGEGDNFKLRQQIRISLFLSIILGIISSLFLFLFKDIIFTFMGVSQGLREELLPYYIVRLWGLPFAILLTAFTGIFRGLGKVNTSFIIAFIITLSNIILTIYFLYFAKLPLVGAAYGTILSFILGVFLSLIVLLNTEKKIFSPITFPLKNLLYFGKDSFHLFIRTSAILFGVFFSTSIVSRLGTLPLAAHQITMQLWMLSTFILDGLAISGNILGAYYIGAKKKKILPLLYRRLTLLSFTVGFLFFIVFLIFANLLFSFFTQDTNVILFLKKIWIFIAFAQMVNSFAYVFDGLLFGSRDFKFLSKMMILGVFTILIPLNLVGLHLENLKVVWLGLISLNAYRGIACYFKIKANLKGP